MTEQITHEENAAEENVLPAGEAADPNDSVTAGADAGAETSEAKEADGPTSILDVVSEAVDKIDEAKAEPVEDNASEENRASSDDEQGSDPAPVADAKDEAPKEDDPGHFSRKEWKSLAPKTRERIEWFRAQRRELQSQVEQYKPIVETVQQSGLRQEDVTVLLALGQALQKGDAETFLAGVMPYVELMQEVSGKKLPADLQQKVDEGYTTPDIAAELARARHAASLERSRAQNAQNLIAERDLQARNHAIMDQVRQYEESLRIRDPDYALKRDVIERETERLIRANGVPRSPQDAVTIAKAAYDFANTVFSKAIPRNPTRPTPSGSQRPSGNVRAAPSNMLEAIEAGLSHT